MRNVVDEFVSLGHHGHVRFHNTFTEPAKLLVILSSNDLSETGIRHAIVLEKAGNLEESAQTGVALHAELEVVTIGRLAGDAEPRQCVYPDLLVDDLPS